MKAYLVDKQIEEIEHILDQTSLDAVIDALATVCWEKADHLRSNWQDDMSAKVWERKAKALAKLATRFLEGDAP